MSGQNADINFLDKKLKQFLEQMMKRTLVTLLALCGFLSHGHCELPTAPDAVIQNIEIQTGCVGDLPVYNVEYLVVNIGEEPITEYCIEIWNEDYYQCFDSDLFGSYEIPPGEGQLFTTQFFEFNGNPGGFFVISVDGVNDEIITGNNNTTIYYPEEWETCPIECIADTIVITEYENVYITDTLLITEYENVYIYDTTYIDVEVPVYITDTIFLVDTTYVNNYIYDTTFVDVIEYVYLTDTIIESIEIDCNTGLPCEDPGMQPCWPWAVYIPNVMTPNNDGWNDVWQPVYDLDCWVDVEFKIYNRWGSLVFEGWDDGYWNGSNDGGPSYVADGVYVYTFKARKWNSTEMYIRNGHITILR
jgi:gliding motility-associated-like protein